MIGQRESRGQSGFGDDQDNVVLAPLGGAVGVVFGFLPARRAAGLDPIEALRRE